MRYPRFIFLAAAALCLAGLPEEGLAAKRRAKVQKRAVNVMNELLRKAQLGDMKAQEELGKKYLTGSGVPQDYAAAAKWLSQSAEKGSAEAAYQMALIHTQGLGVPKDELAAVPWLRRSAKAGFEPAWKILQDKFEDGTLSPDPLELKRLEDLAGKGNAAAQRIVGEAYYRGKGVQKDVQQAEAWLKKSADAGNAKAQALIGEMQAASARTVEWKVSAFVELYKKVAQDLMTAKSWKSWGVFAGIYFFSFAVGRILWRVLKKISSSTLYRSFVCALLFTPTVFPEPIELSYQALTLTTSGGSFPWSCFFVFTKKLHPFDFAALSGVPFVLFWFLSMIVIGFLSWKENRRPPAAIQGIPP